jgi:hypothetical protein
MRLAVRVSISTFGVLAGVAGIEHGIGEMLQGSTRPEGLVIQSWPGSPAFELLSGEPAMTVIPNLLLSGFLTVLFSLAFMVWSVRFIQHKHGSLGLILLSLILLLVGGGFGPPLLGLILGSAGLLAGLSGKRTVQMPPSGLSRLMGKAWPWVYGVGLAAWLMLFPGMPLLAYFAGMDNAVLVMGIILLAFVSLFLTLWTASARDAVSLAPGAAPASG